MIATYVSAHTVESAASASIDAAKEQTDVNRLVIDQAHSAMIEIFRVLHQTPTPKMRAEVSLALIDYGLALWLAVFEASKAQEDAAQEEDHLKRATSFATAYGAPCVGGGISHKVDLRPPMQGGSPPTAADPLFKGVKEVDPAQTAWRQSAIAALGLIVEDLRTRGLTCERACIQDGVSQGINAETADGTTCMIVRVGVTNAAEPYTLEIIDARQHADALVRAHSTTHQRLLNTIDAFLAGQRSSSTPEVSGTIDDLAAYLRTGGIDVYGQANGFRARATLNDRQLCIDVRKYESATQPFLIYIEQSLAGATSAAIVIPERAASFREAKNMIADFLTSVRLGASTVDPAIAPGTYDAAALMQYADRTGLTVTPRGDGFQVRTAPRAGRQQVYIDVYPSTLAHKPYLISAVEAIKHDENGGAIAVVQRPATLGEGQHMIDDFLAGFWAGSRR